MRVWEVHASACSRASSEHGVLPVVVLPHIDGNEVLAVREEEDEDVSGAAVHKDRDPRHLDHAHHRGKCRVTSDERR